MEAGETGKVSGGDAAVVFQTMLISKFGGNPANGLETASTSAAASPLSRGASMAPCHGAGFGRNGPRGFPVSKIESQALIRERETILSCNTVSEPVRVFEEFVRFK